MFTAYVVTTAGLRSAIRNAGGSASAVSVSAHWMQPVSSCSLMSKKSGALPGALTEDCGGREGGDGTGAAGVSNPECVTQQCQGVAPAALSRRAQNLQACLLASAPPACNSVP